MTVRVNFDHASLHKKHRWREQEEMKSMGTTSAESNRGMWRHTVPLLLNYATSSQRENGLSRHPGPRSQGDTESPSLETSVSKLVSLFCNQEGFTLSVKHRTRGYECVWCVYWCVDQHVYDYLLSNHLQCWQSLTKSSALLKGNLVCLFATVPPTIPFPFLILPELENMLW